MRKIFSAFFFIITFFFSAKVNGQSINETNEIIELINKNPQIKLPYGEKYLFTKFPKSWKKLEHKNTYDSLYNKFHYNAYQDIEDKNRKTFSVKYYENIPFLDPSFFISDSVKKFNKKIEFKNLKIISNEKYSIFSIIYQGDIDCDDCEYIVHQTQNILISIGNNNIVIDKLIISEIIGNDLGLSSSFFLIDKNKIIHIKYFESDELDVDFVKYEKFQINKNGKFIRYYEKNGNFKNSEEKGFVKNNKREGKWIEMKYNSNLYKLDKEKQETDYYSYMEANYNNGLQNGETKFFKLIQKYDDNGEPILSSRKKGKLVYIETYKYGELIGVKFVK
jgi:hypothetical protein